jgi:hypothetical protein
VKTELNRRGLRPGQVSKTGMSEVQFSHHTKPAEDAAHREEQQD